MGEKGRVRKVFVKAAKVDPMAEGAHRALRRAAGHCEEGLYASFQEVECLESSQAHLSEKRWLMDKDNYSILLEGKFPVRRRVSCAKDLHVS